MERGNALYISRLDGSERKLVAALQGTALYFPIWSLDSQWLIINIPNPDALDGRDDQVLLDLNSCRVFPLPHYTGEVHSWGKE